MAWWTWALPLLTIAGLVIGFFIGRTSSAGIKRSIQLDQELRESKDEIERYRNRVVEHFSTTAELVNRMTADYRAVYEHLASGAQDLAGNQVPRLEAIISSKKEQPMVEPPAGGIGDGLHEDPDDQGGSDESTDERETAKKDSERKAETPKRPDSDSGDKSDEWYDDAAPGTEVPDYARDERFR